MIGYKVNSQFQKKVAHYAIRRLMHYSAKVSNENCWRIHNYFKTYIIW